MDFHLDTLLNLQNVTVFSYSSELDYTILKLQLVNDGINCPNCHEYTRVKELTVKQVSENEKMSEDAVQDIFHKVAQLKKKTGEFLND